MLCPFCILVAPVSQIGCSNNIFCLLRALEPSHYPPENLKTTDKLFVSSTYCSLPQIVQNSDLVLSALQLPDVKVGYIKHAHLQAFYFTSGSAAKSVVCPPPTVPLPIFFYSADFPYLLYKEIAMYIFM